MPLFCDFTSQLVVKKKKKRYCQKTSIMYKCENFRRSHLDDTIYYLSDSFYHALFKFNRQISDDIKNWFCHSFILRVYFLDISALQIKIDGQI